MANKSSGGKSKKSVPGQAWLTLTICILVVVIFNVLNATSIDSKIPTRVTFNQFNEMLVNGDIDTVFIDTQEANIKFRVYTEETRGLTPTQRGQLPVVLGNMYITDYLNNNEMLTQLIVESGAILEYRSFGASSTMLAVLQMVLGIGINLGFLYMVYRLMKKQTNFSSGQKAQMVSEQVSNIHFSDIIGQDEVIDDIKHVIKVMQDKDKYAQFNVRLTKGILLIGPPGTGKTMIAKALANEAHMNFFSVNSSALIDRFVGMGAKNIRETFEEAKKHTPCIIFLDEIDAIGGSRQSGIDNSEHRQTLNALLQELDGFNGSENILVIGATNCYEYLDKALVRAGRFDRKIIINPPRDSDTRLALLKHYLGDSITDEVNLDVVAKQLAGFTGADIDQVSNEAKLICIQKGEARVTQDIIDEAIEKALFNGNRTKTKYVDDLNIVAHHECGHALSLLLNGLPVARISVVPNTSGVGGMVLQQEGDTLFYKKNDIRCRVKSMYSGRIAEELVFGAENITSGASSDLKQANNMLDNYINDFAFDSEYGLIPLAEEKAQDKKRELAQELYNEAREEIRDNLDILKSMAVVVLENETMDGESLTDLYHKLVAEKKDSSSGSNS